MENPIKMDDLGVPPFSETPISLSYLSFILEGKNNFPHCYVGKVERFTQKRSIEFGEVKVWWHGITQGHNNEFGFYVLL